MTLRDEQPVNRETHARAVLAQWPHENFDLSYIELMTRYDTPNVG